MNYLPLFVDLSDRPCLVVGGGVAAAAKARLLLAAGARVSVVAPRPEGGVAELLARDDVTHLRRGFRERDVAGRAVVFAASGEPEVDARVARAARAAGVPVNAVDRADLSTFITPAIVDRDPVVVAVSSGGVAPVLARRLRRRIEALLPPGLGRLARFAGSFRGAVRATIPGVAARRRFWEDFFDGPLAEAVLRGETARAREEMLRRVNRPAPAPAGAVAIVGAGPGDPDLLTLRALRLLEGADVVVYDRLIGPGILDRARAEAERVFVGKAKGRHGMGQAAINALMARHAKAGRSVVRLKGGDPLVFGRGGEELDYLRAAGVPVEVVPGVTAAAGCAAYAGFALTHRDHASALTLISAHAKEGEPDLDWAALARSRQTLVVYMGRAKAAEIARRLIEHGADAATPAAIVVNGTRPDQSVAVGTLGGLGRLAAESPVAGPALIVIGDVVGMAGAQAWAAPPRAAAI